MIAPFNSFVLNESVEDNSNESKNDDDDDTEVEAADEFLRDMAQRVFGSLEERQRQQATSLDDESSSTSSQQLQLPGGISKGDLYDEEELQKVWSAHQDFISMTTTSTEQQQTKLTEREVPTLHQELLAQLGVNGNDNDSPCMAPLPPPLEVVETATIPSWLDDNFQRRIKNVCAIASDVDGTLLTSTYTMHPRTKLAIIQAMKRIQDPNDKLQHFFPATGKSQVGCMNSLPTDISKLLKNNVPGVFIQGLYVVDHDDTIIFEKRLELDTMKAAEELATKIEIGGFIGYDGNVLYTPKLTETAKTLCTRYGEPMAIELNDGIPLYEHCTNGVHKLLYLDEDIDKLQNVIRPQLEELAKKYNAEVTQAMPTILELLPPGCSKALGVQKLCEYKGIDMETELLSMGDAENDVQMLQQSSIGVAMGNASPPASDAADFKMEETNNDGGAGAAMETFGFGYVIGLE